MAQRSKVPQFGNWDGDENVPYTAYFEKARKGRPGAGGKIMNPNDPEENPDMLSEYASPARAPISKAKVEVEGHGAVRRGNERRKSKDESELKQFADSPARHEQVNRKAPGDPMQQRHGGRGGGGGGGGGGEINRRPPARQSVGSENSFERSPLHNHAKLSGRGSGPHSPAWEGKGSHESSHGTPGRSRLRPKSDESPDKSTAVPKFGEWDENNPASADGFTHIFNKVREDKNTGGRTPNMSNESPYPHDRKPPQTDNAKCCCFPWGRK